MIDISHIVSKWEIEEPLYSKIASYSISLLKSEIARKGINAEISWRTKDIVSLIKKVKKKISEKEYSYEDIGDKLGIRVVCSFNDELEVIDLIIKNVFSIQKRDIKKENLRYNSLEYTSNHYDVKLKPNPKKRGIENLENLLFEIQVRTINQDAWAKIAHKLSYKNDQGLNESLNRSVYRLLTLYELADEEFNRVNAALLKESESTTYALIRRLEKYSYKYAKADFDRDLSEYYIDMVLRCLDDEGVRILNENIEKFISEKEDRIIQIFQQLDVYKNEHFWLTTQPEVFVIWYCIENHFYVLRDNWGQIADTKEIEFLSNIWGKSLNYL